MDSDGLKRSGPWLLRSILQSLPEKKKYIEVYSIYICYIYILCINIYSVYIFIKSFTEMKDM